MKKIVRNISLEAIKSRFPGLLPYFEVKDQLVSTHYCDEDPVNGNWGHMVCNFMLNDSGFMPSFKDSSGNDVFVFQEINKRYKLLKDISEKRICLEHFSKNGEKCWKLGKDPIYLERENMPQFSCSDFDYDTIDHIKKDLDFYFYISNVDDEIWDNNEKILIIPEKDKFNSLGGFKFIEFFEELIGIFEIPEELQNEQVPKYLYYWKIEKLYRWMYHHAKIKNPETKEKWNLLGGVKMMRLLTDETIREDKVAPINFLRATLKKVKSFELLIPEFYVDLNINSKVIDLGTMMEDSSVDLIESEKEMRPRLFKTNDSIICKSESRLSNVKSKGANFDDSGNELPGELMKKIKYENGENLSYILTYDKGKKTWTGKYYNEQAIANMIYKTIPFIELAVKSENIIVGRFRIEYEDGRKFVETGEPQEYYLIEGDKKTWIKDKEIVNIVEWNNNFLPEEIENIIYKTNRVIYKDSKIVFGKRDVFEFKNGKWEKKKEPEVEISKLKPTDYLKVLEDDGLVIYAMTGSPMSGIIDRKFYRSEIKSSRIPYYVKKPFNVRVIGPDGKNTKAVADFIDKIYISDGNITFDYLISAECFINSNYSVVGYNGKNGKGMRYKESYEISYDNPVMCNFGGSEVECYFDELDFESKIVEVSSREYGLTRKTLLSELNYAENDTWIHGNPSAFESFRTDGTMGITSINTPEINVAFNRGNAAMFEPRFKLMECNTMQDLKNYGNNYFNLD